MTIRPALTTKSPKNVFTTNPAVIVTAKFLKIASLSFTLLILAFIIIAGPAVYMYMTFGDNWIAIMVVFLYWAALTAGGIYTWDYIDKNPPKKNMKLRPTLELQQELKEKQEELAYVKEITNLNRKIEELEAELNEYYKKRGTK